MDATGFEREYGSVWTGTLEGAFFDINKFDKHRVLNIAETQYNKGINKEEGYYALGVDVGRTGLTEWLSINLFNCWNILLRTISTQNIRWVNDYG